MDPASLIVGALAAGTIAGTQEVATTAVKEAYAELKALLRRWFRGRPAAMTALEQHELAPRQWAPVLEMELSRTGALSDPAVLSSAQKLRDAARAVGIEVDSDTYTIDARNAHGFAVGRNSNVNIFHPPSDPSQKSGS